MQTTYDIHTVIIVVTFLAVLIFISYFINKKKDLLRSHFKPSNFVNITFNSLIGNGNRLTIFEIKSKSYLVITSRSNISNIITLPDDKLESKYISGEKNA